jgi:hypothetical protein
LEFTIGKSYGLVLPALLGTGVHNNELSALSDFESWDSYGVVTESARTKIDRGLVAAWNKLEPVIDRELLADKAKLLLVTLAQETRAFLGSLFDWMSAYYRRYTQQGAMTPTEAWELVQYLVCAIFKDLREASYSASTIKFGSASRTGDTAGRIFWSVLRMHGIMQDYVRLKFEGHPSIAPALNKYLLQKVTMKTHLEDLSKVFEAKWLSLHMELKALSAKVAQIATMAAGAQKAVDQAQKGGAGKKNKKAEE